MRRVVTAATVAVPVGVLVALLSGMAFEPFALIGQWGTRNGLIAAGIAFLTMVGRGTRRPGNLARWFLVAVLGLVAYGITGWTVTADTPPWSLEGAWLWPTTVAALASWD